MYTQNPIQYQERTIIVDVLRGFALFGVLLGNLSGMISNNVPSEIIEARSTFLDHFMDLLHSVLIQNKFMTLFSILFGYGFGVIIERLEKKHIPATPFFLRRMLWLFVFGCVNLFFWNGDILHVYAMTGIFLLFFRKANDRTILLSCIFFLVLLPFAIRLCQQFLLHYSLDESVLVANYYHAYKFGSLWDIAKVNYSTYPRQWIFDWIEWRDMSETLGRFLLGYYIVRKKILSGLNENISLVSTIWRLTFILSLLFIPFEIIAYEKIVSIPRYVQYPFIKAGTLTLTLFYSSSLILIYYKKKLNGVMEAFRNLGCMTLTNYLTHTLLFLIIFYGVGFGLLGEFSFSIAWLATFIIYIFQAIFSKWWMQKYYYGPVEWIWRQLTYLKRFRLKREPVIS